MESIRRINRIAKEYSVIVESGNTSGILSEVLGGQVRNGRLDRIRISIGYTSGPSIIWGYGFTSRVVVGSEELAFMSGSQFFAPVNDLEYYNKDAFNFSELDKLSFYIVVASVAGIEAVTQIEVPIVVEVFYEPLSHTFTKKMFSK